MSGSKRLEGRVVLLTGASAGLGVSFARAMAAEGGRLALCARRLARLEALSAEIADTGGEAVAIELDVTDSAHVRRAIDATEAALGPVDVLVNNAGVAAPKWITDITEDDYDRLLATNAKGPWLMAQEVGRRMIARGRGGQIVNIASMGGLIATRLLSVYGMSKAAVLHMTRHMALEWARHDINVNAICPGYVSTEMNDYFFNSEEGKKFVSQFLRRRLMTADDLIPVLILLASGESRALTAAAIPVDDGQSFSLY